MKEKDFHYTRKHKAWQALALAAFPLSGFLPGIFAGSMESMMQGRGLFPTGVLLFCLAGALYSYFYEVDDVYVFSEKELIWKRNNATFMTVPWTDICGTGMMSLQRNDPHARPIHLSVSFFQWSKLRKLILARVGNGHGAFDG